MVLYDKTAKDNSAIWQNG